MGQLVSEHGGHPQDLSSGEVSRKSHGAAERSALPEAQGAAREEASVERSEISAVRRPAGPQGCDVYHP